MKFLVVDDEYPNRLYLKKLLCGYGDCDVAEDGQEAINAFIAACKNKEPYDLICMDIMMPNVGGREATIKIRELEMDMGVQDSSEVKIIMTSAFGDTNNVADSLIEGATSYIVKPVEKFKLIEEMKKAGLMVDVE